MLSDVDCPLGMPHGNLRWPASADTLLATIRELLRFSSSAPTEGGSQATASDELVSRLTFAASYQVDPEGVVVAWSPAAERQFGYTEQEAQGHFLPIVDDSRREEFMSMLASAVRGQPLYRWGTQHRAKGGRLLSMAVSMLPVSDWHGKVRRIQIVAADISEVRNLQDELQRLSSIIRASADFVCVVDDAGCVVFMNPAASRLAGFDAAALPAETTLDCLMTPAARDLLLQVALPRAVSEAVYLNELVFVNAGNEEVPVSVQVVALDALPHGHFAIVARDISAQKRVEAKLLRLNRIHEVLSKCSEAIQREGAESELLAAVCHLLTDVGGHRFAMISLIDPRADQMLDPAAWSGDDDVSAADLVTSWSPDHARGQGPTGTAVRSGQTIVRRDADSNADYLPWQSFNARLGLRSVIALPLMHGTASFGALSIYSTQASIFDADEVNLLQSLARRLSYGIHSRREAAARRDAEAALRMFAGAIDSTQDGVMITDALRPDHPIRYVNPAFTRITGWEADEVLGKNGRILVAGELQQPEMDVIRHALRGRIAGHAILRCYRKDGQPFWNELHVAPIRDAGNNVTHYASVIADVSERISRENQLAHLAMHDPLTGLANRTLLTDRLQQAIARAQRDGRLVALLLIDLDRFKQINDTLGHGAGDILLQTIAARLKALALDSDTVARLGGDEFVLLLTDLDNELDVPRTGHLLLDHLATPFMLCDEEIRVTPSIGAAIYPLDAGDGENLLRLADVAMYEAKESGRNAFRCFAPEMGQRSQHQVALEKDLRHALERNELLLYYQPKADLYSGNVTGVEALIRWKHPERGLVPPAQFIPLAEATGLIVPIGAWVLREACRQAREWQRAGLPPLRVAVNLSALQFREKNLVEQVVQVLADSGLEPGCLELEVTESMVMDSPETAEDFLKRFKKMGVRLAMDDFGTGYSSLGYLRRFPFDVLKIDRSFVQNIVSEPGDALIAVAVIAMAHSLGLQVIAEGVETESQMRYLRTHLCDEIQGYLFSPPLPAADIAGFLVNPVALVTLGTGKEHPERTLLLVDDEPDVLNSLKRLLRRSGYRILTANSAAEGLELLALNNVQVIVSDQRMPTMSGSEFLSRVKALYPETMRIVLSGYTELGALTDAINRGAIYKFVTKPWEDDELREVIREAFVRHEERKSGGAA